MDAHTQPTTERKKTRRKKMASLSGDESEIIAAEPVRRTRSGRAVTNLIVTKKSPVKKLLARATRSHKKAREGEDYLQPEPEEEVYLGEEENLEETEDASENGLLQQTLESSISEQTVEEEGTTFHLELEDSQDIVLVQDTDILHQDQNPDTEIRIVYRDRDVEEEVPELEAPPPPLVTKVTPSGSIVSTLKVKETIQLIDTEMSENSMEPAELDAEEEVESEEVMETIVEENDEVMDDFHHVLNQGEEAEEIVEMEPLENGTQNSFVHESLTGFQMDVESLKTSSVDHSMLTTDSIETDTKRPESSDENPDEKEEKAEPDTEAVSEDELPTEAAAKEPETEAVSDEELPAAAPADLGETESVSEDELPPDSDKKKKAGAKALSKAAADSAKTKPEGGAGKRKLNAEGEYDPSSPTSENNDETPAKKVAITSGVEGAENKPEAKPASPKKKALPELDKYWKAVNEDPSDFTGWTYLLQYVDQENDAEAAREAYTKFLERYPYCYGYWRKFADYEKKKGNPENCQTVFDQGLKAISLSVDLWLHYINHCKTVYENDEEKLREQYERAIEACGLEFRSDRLWESYIKWELEAKRLSRVTALYDRLLSTPTLCYLSHFEAFQEFVSSNLPNKILNVDDFLTLRAEVKALLKSDEATTATASVADDAPPGEEPSPHEVPPTDEETRAIREKIISTRRKMHKANVNAVAARWSYEEGIKRPYFHVKPLERCQLKNWKEYLDFEIEQKDPARIIILFERCLIACALYDEFWMRFVRYLETQKSENAEKIRDVYSRACIVHHPKKPNLHLQWATFEEGQGNFEKASEILEKIDAALPNMLQIAYRRVNLERRRGDLDKACALYENYISNSKNRTIANNVAVKYARFLCKVKNDIDKAVKVLLKATDKDKDNPRLYLQLIDLGLQRSPVDTSEVVGYMDMFIEREHADLEQRVLFAQRKVEFLEDFSPDIRQVLKAHEQFQKCIKQAKERKKAKNEDSKSETSPPKKVKPGDQSSIPPPPSVGSQSSYQYGSGPSGPYQSQQPFQGGQYSGQGSYQQGYQQYPPPSDPNYANYQNWQYGQGGPQAYGPYNQWGSYNYY
ncbi:pre-mRNA-processing factor 39 [Neodiprion virginianus]|uniref:pre-mRNA-processing factor 39 n=1 Tax=Neodiprion virginianus TaxID=2961670 RepID=UPI001EE6FCF6|nr:pre-mRNA-processing factor 39 [Neodiprion virginianus]